MGKEPLHSKKNLFPYGTVINRDGTPWLPSHLREGALPGPKADAGASNQTLEVKVDADAEASPTACPFCGVDARDWDIELCEHALADFGDGSDADRGILCGSGGSRCGNAALDCLSNLESAVAGFATALGLEEGNAPNPDEQLAVRRSLDGAANTPAWWQPLVDGLSDGLDDVALFRTVEAIWDTMAPWSADLVSTTAILGGPMTTSNVTFIWARNPQEAVKTIASTIGAIEAEIRAASSSLKGSTAPGMETPS